MQINPALKELEFLVGEWAIELSNASFLPDPNQKPKVLVAYKWIEDGAAIAARHDKKADSPQSAVWIIGRDDGSHAYTALYSDKRGVSRVYQMSYKDSIWRMWRDNPEFSQRFEGRVSEDRKTIDAEWEKSSDDGKTWEHDFDMAYTKV